MTTVLQYKDLSSRSQDLPEGKAVPCGISFMCPGKSNNSWSLCNFTACNGNYKNLIIQEYI
jgi:hypothetical protein